MSASEATEVLAYVGTFEKDSLKEWHARAAVASLMTHLHRFQGLGDGGFCFGSHTGIPRIVTMALFVGGGPAQLPNRV